MDRFQTGWAEIPGEQLLAPRCGLTRAPTLRRIRLHRIIPRLFRMVGMGLWGRLAQACFQLGACGMIGMVCLGGPIVRGGEIGR